MKVFISWSGERSNDMGHIVKDLLEDVLDLVEPWISDTDIKTGSVWGKQIGDKLKESTVGIICVTKDNGNAPWLYYEAGALANAMDENLVIPLSLDVDFKDLPVMLMARHGVKIGKDGLWDIVKTVNSEAGHKVREDNVKKRYDLLWHNEYEKRVSNLCKRPIVKDSDIKPVSVKPQGELLEEILKQITAMNSRIGDIEDSATARPAERYEKKSHGESNITVHDKLREADQQIRILQANINQLEYLRERIGDKEATGAIMLIARDFDESLYDELKLYVSGVITKDAICNRIDDDLKKYRKDLVRFSKARDHLEPLIMGVSRSLK